MFIKRVPWLHRIGGQRVSAEANVRPLEEPVVFISYAREDRGFAQWLAGALEGHGLLTAADWKIPTGSDYKEWIARSIDESTAFLFIISEWSTRSEPCLGELRRAVQQRLRLLPVVRCIVPDDLVPDELKLPNWLFFQEEDSKQDQLLTLVRDARTDLDAVLEERDWRRREGEWERGRRPGWFLVSPSLARSAETYVSARPREAEDRPQPHQAYFAALRRAYRRQKIWATAVTLVVSAVVTAAGVLAWNRSQGQIAQRALAEALGLQRSEPAQTRFPALLAIESLSRSPSLGASELLSSMLPDMSRPVRLYSVEGSGQYFVGVSADGRLAMAAGADGRVTVWDLAQRTTQSLSAEGGSLMSAALTPDGAHIITSSADRGLRIWSVADRSIQRVVRLTEAASVVAVTSDLSRAVTGGAAGLVEVWDLRTGDSLGRFQHAKPVEAVAVDASGNWIAAGSEDGTASLWDARDRHRRILQHWKTVYDVLFWDAQRMLLTASATGDVRLWSVHRGDEPERRLDNEGGSIVTKLALSGDGRRLSSLSFASSVQVWNPATGTRIATLHEAPTLVAMTLSDDGARVLTAGHDEAAHLWDARSGKELTTWKVNGHPRHVALSRFSEVAVVGTMAGAEVWKLTRPSRMPVLRHHAPVTRIRLSPDGATIAALSEKTVWVWSIETGRQLAWIRHSSGMSDVALDENGTRVVVAGESGTGAVYSVPDGRRLCEFRTTDVQSAAAISRDGRLAAIGSWDGHLVFCDVTTGREVARFKGDSAVKAIALASNDDAANVIVGRGDGSIEQCHPTIGCRLLVQQEGPIRRLAAAPPFHLIASTAPDLTLRLWDSRARRQSAAFTQLGFNTDVALTRIGDFVATASERGVQIWRTQSREEIWRLERLGAVNAVALSPTGDRVAIAIGEEVRVLGTRAEELITEACRQMTRNLSREEWHKLLPGVRYKRVCPDVP